MASSPVRLGDFVSLVRGTTYKSSRLGEPGPVLLGLASIQRDGGFRDNNLKTYGGESPDRLTLEPGDLYVSLKDVTQSGDLLGAVARVPKHITKGRLTQDTVRLQFAGDVGWRDYVYWVLRTPEYRSYCRSRAIGTTNLSLSRADFLDFEVPPMNETRSTMVALLESLDDKIELNRKMSRTLDETAQAIFRSLFLRLDGIPDGWSLRPLDSLGEFRNGLAMQRFPSQPGRPTLPVIKIAQLRAASVAGADAASADLDSKYIVEDGDLLFSWSGSLEAVRWTGGTGALNQHVFKVTSSEYPLWFLYFWIHEHLPDFRRTAAGKATTMGHINRGHLTQAMAAVPPPEVLDEANRTIQPLVDRSILARLECRTLALIRDSVLPCLLFAERSAPGAQIVVEEVI
jgi:type I restriction enzyme S subunit